MRTVILSLASLVVLASLTLAGPHGAPPSPPGNAFGFHNSPPTPPGNAFGLNNSQPGHAVGKNGFHPWWKKTSNSNTPPGHAFGNNGNRPWWKKIIGK